MESFEEYMHGVRVADSVALHQKSRDLRYSIVLADATCLNFSEVLQ